MGNAGVDDGIYLQIFQFDSAVVVLIAGVLSDNGKTAGVNQSIGGRNVFNREIVVDRQIYTSAIQTVIISDSAVVEVIHIDLRKFIIIFGITDTVVDNHIITFVAGISNVFYLDFCGRYQIVCYTACHVAFVTECIVGKTIVSATGCRCFCKFDIMDIYFTGHHDVKRCIIFAGRTASRHIYIRSFNVRHGNFSILAER